MGAGIFLIILGFFILMLIIHSILLKTAEKEVKPKIQNVSLNQEKTISVKQLQKKTQPLPSKPLYKSTDSISNTPPPDNNGDFTTSMMVGMSTDNGLIGGLVGGDLLGGMVGEMLHDSITQDEPQSYEEPTQETQSYESDSTSNDSNDYSSSNDDYSSSNDNN
jgi:hypothetical protein